MVSVASGATLAFNEATGTVTNAIADTGTVAGAETTGNTNTLSGAITGTGGFTQTGAGTTILSGANSYTGATAVSAGTLQIGNGTNGSISGTSTVTVASGATLAFNEATGTVTNAIADSGTVAGVETAGITNTLSGAITGTGGFTQTGAGTTIFTGTNTYSGGTTISAGKLQIGNGGATGSVVGNVTDNGALVLDLSGSSTNAAVISGTGSLTQMGAGTVILTGANTYSGATTVSAGGLQIGNGTTGTINNASAVSVAAGTTLGFDEATGLTQSNAITDSGTVAGVEGTGITNTLSGIISGAGTFTQTGAGTTVLTGANTYSGGTSVTAGTLVAGSSTVVAGGVITSGPFGKGPLTLAMGTTLEDNGGNVTLAYSLNLSGSITLGSTGSGTLTFNGTTLNTPATVALTGNTTLTVNNTTTIDDAISGNFSLTKLGTGTLTLTGANSSTGATTVTSGTLVLSNADSLSSGLLTLAGGTALDYTGAAATLNQDITVSSGSATIDNGGTGLLTLAGTLDKDGTTLVLDGGADGITVTGQITGANSGSDLDVVGGVTTLTNANNNYNGPTVVEDGGTLVDDAVGGALPQSTTLTIGGADNSTGTFNLDGNNQTIAGLNTQGTGGAGNIVTNGGGTAGVLTVTNGGNFAGLIKDGASTTGLALSGGTLLLSSANTYSGGTTISGGTLVAGNSNALGSNTVTQSGGTLMTNSAGGAPLTIDVSSFVQNGGTLSLNLNGMADTSDVLAVTGNATLNGTLELVFTSTPTKGEVFNNILTTGGTITAASASYSAPTVSPPGFQVSTSPMVLVGADSISITVTSVQLSLTGLLGNDYTPNRAAILNYIDTNVLSGPLFKDLSAVLVASPNSATAANIADQFNPVKFANFNRSNIFNNAVFSTQELDSYLESGRSPQGDFLAGHGGIDSSGLTVVDPSMDPALAQVGSRLLAWSPAPFAHGMLSDSADPVLAGVDMKQINAAPAPEAGNGFNTFVVGNVVLAQNYSDPQTNVAHSDSTTGGMQIGADYRLTPHLRAGVVFGYNHTDGSLDNNGSKATIDSYAPGIYVSFADKGWYANAIGNYGFDNFTEDRAVSIGGASAMAHGAPSGDQITGDLDGGYDFHTHGFTFGPLAGVQYTHLDVGSFSEDGAQALGADMTVGKQETDSLRSRLGGHVSYVFQTNKVLLTPHLDVSWQHEFMDQSEGINGQIVNVVAAPFTVKTPNPSRDSALIDAGLDADLGGQVTVFGDYLIQAGQSNYFGQSVQAGVKIGF